MFRGAPDRSICAHAEDLLSSTDAPIAAVSGSSRRRSGPAFCAVVAGEDGRRTLPILAPVVEWMRVTEYTLAYCDLLRRNGVDLGDVRGRPRVPSCLQDRRSHRDGYKAHLAAEPDTGLVTDAELTPDNNRRRGGGRPGRLLFVVIRGPCVWWPSEPMRVRAAASIRAGEHGGN